ncbi:MAG: iron-sulfur cluster assembly protein [Actinomycetota bacterium]
MTTVGPLQPETVTVDDLIAAVWNVLGTVDDPEYPGISIVELGLVFSVEVDGTTAHVGLIPTFSGCPALAMIAEDVSGAVRSVPGLDRAEVRWLTAPTWSIERVTPKARAVLADRFTVAVRIGSGPVPCPRCGKPTEERSLFGPSRCRAVHRCEHCIETIEVLRS